VGVTHSLDPDLVKPITDLLAQAGPVERPIRSRWGYDAVPEWRRVPASTVCEVGYKLVDGPRWLRYPATFHRWRPVLQQIAVWTNSLVRSWRNDRTTGQRGRQSSRSGPATRDVLVDPDSAAAPAAVWRTCSP
jgi:hypothetical protein